jgi:site-specific recombinase XerD
MLVYSAGLRVSEAVKLKLSDIDTNRKTLFLQGAKGRKDRYTILSEKARQVLVEYLDKTNISSGWLFPGQEQNNKTGRHLTTRTAEKIFTHALEKAGIGKEVSIHSLRHAFATHLVENGTDISYVQQLMGHVSLRTTQRYTHVAIRDVLRVVSPLDAECGNSG